MDHNSGITEARTNLNSKLEQHPKERSKCTIYRLHGPLRDVNPSAYEPEVIAIGPYHRGKDNLKMMEDHKLHTLQVLVKRGRGITEYEEAVRGLASKARKCYADQDLKLSESEFIEMLVLDGCFIVELVRKFKWKSLREKDDPIFQMAWMFCNLRRDLMLFENQVPFFVLEKLFDLIKDRNEGRGLVHLLSNFFSDIYPGRGHLHLREVSFHGDGGQEIMHLLDLIYRNWVPPRSQESDSSGRKKESQMKEKLRSYCIKLRSYCIKLKAESQESDSRGKKKESQMEEKKEFQFINCATRLTEANVKFEVKEDATLFDIKFEDGVMMMAPLHIADWTECFLRNLIAYEQYFQQSRPNFVTDYRKFLDCLINSSEDVEILSQNGIITNWQGDDEVVATMVNRLGDSVIIFVDCFNYAKIFEDVNDHCRKPWNKWMAKLRRDYFNSPWAIISILAAVVLLLLTVAQTVFTILG